MRLPGFLSAIAAAARGRSARPSTEVAVVKAPVGPSLQGLAEMVSGTIGGFLGVIREPFTGAWQRNREIRRDTVLTNWAVFSCLTLIAGDAGKMRLRLVELKDSGIWVPAESAAFTPVLRKPNRYQTTQKFIEQWLISKLTHGNTYVLKERDARGVVVALYVLDPLRVRPLVAPDGSVYYAVGSDLLAGVAETTDLAIPASEIIHDRMWCLFHALCGISPIFACGLAAMQGLKIQENSEAFFANMSRPGGILTAPGQIGDDTAKRLKEHWDKEFTGVNIGKVAVLGDGLEYKAMAVNAVEADMVAQLKLTAEMVCSTYHVPPFKVGMGALPAGQKVGDMNQIYYSDCLQTLLKSIEDLLDEGLGLVDKKDGKQLGTYFELDDLIAMDAMSQVAVLVEKVKGTIMMPNEARTRQNLPPAAGGDALYMQQQNYSLEALAKRDAREDPFATSSPAAPNTPPAPAAAPAPEPAPAPAAGKDMESFTKAFLRSLAEPAAEET